jgi:hypothetical protein
MKKIFLITTLIFASRCCKANDINIKNFGAIGDGKTMNTKALQMAIDKCSKNGGKVIIPAGIFLTGSIHLRSDVDLYLCKGAVLQGSTGLSDYEKNTNFALILAQNQHNLAISGEGIIDGQGQQLAANIAAMWKDGQLKENKGNNRPDEKYRPQIIELDNCSGVKISGVTIKNSACWVQTYRHCKDLSISRIKVVSTAYWNNDGIDIVDCQKVRIYKCDVNSADDGICLKSEDETSGCYHIFIKDCKIRSSANAIKFGTASFGGFQCIKIRNIFIYDTYRSAIALECVDGGFIKNIDIKNIEAVNTGNAFFIRAGKRNANKSAGVIDSVLISHLDVKVPSAKPDKGYAIEGPLDKEPCNVLPSSIVGNIAGKIDHITFADVAIHYEGGGNKRIAYAPADALDDIPERTANYPEFSMFGELPAWGVYIRHAGNITFKNFVLDTDKPDYRPAIVADDVQWLKADKLNINSGKEQPPVIVLRHVIAKVFTSSNFSLPDGKAIKIIP